MAAMKTMVSPGDFITCHPSISAKKTCSVAPAASQVRAHVTSDAFVMEACLRKRIHVHLEDCPVVADEVGIAPPVFVSHDQTAARAGGLQLSPCGADIPTPLWSLMPSAVVRSRSILPSSNHHSIITSSPDERSMTTYSSPSYMTERSMVAYPVAISWSFVMPIRRPAMEP